MAIVPAISKMTRCEIWLATAHAKNANFFLFAEKEEWYVEHWLAALIPLKTFFSSLNMFLCIIQTMLK
jgi:hypothetical protein